MSGVRRSLAFSSIGRYFAIGTGVISTFIAARLMTPAEFGVAVVGQAVLAIGEAIRQLGSVQYLVQERDLSPHKIRTSFTISLIVTIVLSLGVFALAGTMAASYGFVGLAPFMYVQALGFLTGPFVQPIYGLLTRAGRFQRIALIDMITSTAGAAVMITLVATGHSYMGIAWGGLVSAVLGMVLTMASHRDFSQLVPSLREWRHVLTFGIYGSAVALIYKITESIWYLVAGQRMDARSVGLLQRAALLSTFPDRVILAGVAAVALRTFSAKAHGGGDVAPSYLRWMSFATVILWPSLMLIGLLARDIVAVLLGPQWSDAVPIVQVLAVSMAFIFPLTLNYAAQIATGGMRLLPLVAIIQAAVAIPVIYISSSYGLMVVAISNILPNVVAGLASTIVARRFVRFSWSGFVLATLPSFLVAASTGFGPLALILFGFRPAPLIMLVVAGSLGAIGWLIGVWALRHTIGEEILKVLEVVRLKISR